MLVNYDWPDHFVHIGSNIVCISWEQMKDWGNNDYDFKVERNKRRGGDQEITEISRRTMGYHWGQIKMEGIRSHCHRE